MPDFKFMIAGGASSTLGMYQLSFINDATKVYADAPVLNIVLLNKKCSFTYTSSFTVPAGGHSIPMGFSVGSCMPETDVSLTGNATDPTDKTKAAAKVTLAAVE